MLHKKAAFACRGRDERSISKSLSMFAPALLVRNTVDQNMRGRVTCVTGANSGIGFSVAKSLAERNATVHMICRNQGRGEEARERVRAETGNQDVHLHVLDVSDFRQVGQLPLRPLPPPHPTPTHSPPQSTFPLDRGRARIFCGRNRRLAGLPSLCHAVCQCWLSGQ